MKCSRCNKEVRNVGEKTVAVLCGNCVMKEQLQKFGIPKQALPKKKQDESTIKPRGWHWMKEFVDSDGNVYNKGKLVEEKTNKPPTKIKESKKKITKNEKIKKQREIFKEIHENKKKLQTLVKNKKNRGQKGLRKKINKLQKEVKKYL